MTSLLIGGGIVTIGYLLSEVFKKNKIIENVVDFGDITGISADATNDVIKPISSNNNMPENNNTNDAINDSSILSHLTGHIMHKDKFLPSGTEPFYSRKTTQNVDFTKPNLQLAAATGRDPDKRKQKKEIEPLFKPTAELTNVQGSAIYNSNIKHRLNTSRYITGERPFEQIQVGPGLNKGFVSEGSGGFQQNDTRDYIMPKTIDDLRTINNPKLTYKGRTLAPKKSIDKRSTMGTMFKNRPKKMFEKTQKDFFITTGAIKRESGRSTILIKNTNRKISKSIMGNPNKNIGEYDKNSNYKVSKKLSYCNNIARNFDGEHKTTDYGKSSFFLDINKRNITELRTHTTNVAKSVKSLFLPLTDMFRNTTKETTELNTNIGNMALTTHITNLKDKENVQMNTTIRETLDIRENTGNVNRTEQGIYVTDPSDVPDATNKEMSMNINYFSQPVNEQGNGYMTNKHEVRPSNRDNMHNEYIGTGSSNNKESMSYSDMYNAIISGAKEETLKGRTPTTSNMTLTNGANNINLKIKKLDSDYMNNRAKTINQINSLGLNIDHYKQSSVIMKNNVVDNSRFVPDILDKMKNNPYVNKSFM